MTDAGVAGIDPVLGFALVGALGVGSQWLAWRLKLPGIVVMLLAGLAAGPGLGLLLPSEQFGGSTPLRWSHRLRKLENVDSRSTGQSQRLSIRFDQFRDRLLDRMEQVPQATLRLLLR